MEFVEDCLKSLILENVKFCVDGKTIRQGKMKIFSTKQCFIKFKLENGEEVKEWEVPYPYELRKIDNGFIFDYCLSAFCPRSEDSYWKMFLMDRSNASKMYDNYLFVTKLSS